MGPSLAVDPTMLVIFGLVLRRRVLCSQARRDKMRMTRLRVTHGFQSDEKFFKK